MTTEAAAERVHDAIVDKLNELIEDINSIVAEGEISSGEANRIVREYSLNGVSFAVRNGYSVEEALKAFGADWIESIFR